MSQITLYHNPRCSKSRQTLQLLEENGVTPEIVLYLDTPLNAAQIKELLTKLGIGARELLRKGESAYKENSLNDAALSDEVLVEAMVAHPKLIERPIAVKAGLAIIGRPPENVLQLV